MSSVAMICTLVLYVILTSSSCCLSRHLCFSSCPPSCWNFPSILSLSFSSSCSTQSVTELTSSSINCRIHSNLPSYLIFPLNFRLHIYFFTRWLDLDITRNFRFNYPKLNSSSSQILLPISRRDTLPCTCYDFCNNFTGCLTHFLVKFSSCVSPWYLRDLS